MSRRVGLAILALVVLAVAAVWVIADRRAAEAWEWKHGGDDAVVHAEIASATSEDEYLDALAATGAPRSPVYLGEWESYVLDVQWEAASPITGGRYDFILLDARVEPPQPIPAGASWSEDSRVIIGWSGSFNVLAEHYPWLERTADRRVDGAWTNDTQAFGVDAGSHGSAMLSFWLRKRDLPTDRPERDLVLAVVHSDAHGEVQWAKKVPLVRSA